MNSSNRLAPDELFMGLQREREKERKCIDPKGRKVNWIEKKKKRKKKILSFAAKIAKSSFLSHRTKKKRGKGMPKKSVDVGQADHTIAFAACDYCLWEEGKKGRRAATTIENRMINDDDFMCFYFQEI